MRAYVFCVRSIKSLQVQLEKKIRHNLQNVGLLILDEVSMISNITLLYIHLRLTEIFATGESEDGYFGKIYILLLGDLLQLPPVHEDFAFNALNNEKMKNYVRSMISFNLWQLFEYDELTINMRQRNDKTYSDILSRIRLGIVTESDNLTLNTRKIDLASNKANTCLLYTSSLN